MTAVHVNDMGAAPTLRTRLLAAPVGRRGEMLTVFLRAEIAAAMSVAPDEISPRDPLMSLGMSSLKAVELGRRLESELQTRLRTSLLFDFGTLEHLVPHLLSRARLDGAERTQAAPPAAPIAAPSSSDAGDLARLEAELAEALKAAQEPK
jgi:myxalamid-type polyketide synthase MxaB